MVDRDKIVIVGVPQDLGASRRGVDMGPSAIRLAGLSKRLESLGYEVVDLGNIQCHDFSQHENLDDEYSKLRYLPHILKTCSKLKEKVKEAIKMDGFPLILGGDHSLSIGTMAGMMSKHQGKTGILWIDAHGDFNTAETTPSGNIHGMPFATILDRGDERLRELGPSPTALEKNSVLIAARDIDEKEAKTLQDSDVTVYTMREIDEYGIGYVAKEALEIATDGVDNLHVSFDIDALNPSEAPGTGTPVYGGLTYREAHLLMELVYDCNKLSSFEMVEVNPTLDDRNKTAKLAVELIYSALGKKII